MGWLQIRLDRLLDEFNAKRQRAQREEREKLTKGQKTPRKAGRLKYSLNDFMLLLLLRQHSCYHSA
jgi:hypothetical protein